jgi:PD-(D/E)XK endonuclease
VADSKLLSKPKLTNHPVDVGQRTEAAILSELVRRGYAVLLPFGVNQRYDLVLDLDGRFVRCQCKTGRFIDGAIQFPTRSTRSNSRGFTKHGYVGDADFFLVYCAQNRRIYAVPVDDAPGDAMRLRVEPALNGQAHGVNRASDYELPG